MPCGSRRGGMARRARGAEGSEAELESGGLHAWGAPSRELKISGPTRGRPAFRSAPALSICQRCAELRPPRLRTARLGSYRHAVSFHGLLAKPLRAREIKQKLGGGRSTAGIVEKEELLPLLESLPGAGAGAAADDAAAVARFRSARRRLRVRGRARDGGRCSFSWTAASYSLAAAPPSAS